MRDIPRRDRNSIPAADAIRLVHVDAEWRYTNCDAQYSCNTRCQSTEPLHRLLILSRFLHVVGVSFTVEEQAHWRRAAHAAFDDGGPG